jgi:alkanesulfonate monooxygenase SsuD/methylene tetrahydromethanopterin reductase-like flavin-dependent oxidoreductase (luciferase family)
LRRPLELGFSIDPRADRYEEHVDLARAADAAGYDLLGIQDHPYQRRFLDTWTLLSALAPQTERIRLFPNVANLPLRPPAVLAKAAASLDVISGGRAELGLGAGGFWEAIEAIGGPRRSGGESVDALEEAIEVIRLMWSDERSVSFDGRFYSLSGAKPGPRPAHPIGIWLGAIKPRMLRLTGTRADGWSVSLAYVPPDQVRESSARIDEAAAAAGREPSAIRRLYNVSGVVSDGQGGEGEGVLHGPPSLWVETLAEWATEVGLDTFVFWPAADPRGQLERFAADVAPALREAVTQP